VDTLRQPPPKIIYFQRWLAKDACHDKTISEGGHTIMPASKKVEAQKAQVSPITVFEYK
jgi:hypothetical protein